MRLKYDDCIIYQKLSVDEQLILTVNQHVATEEE